MKDTSTSLAAVSSEECAQAVGNLYMLPVLAALRYRELKSGHLPRVKTNAGPKVTALQELEAGVFGFQKVIGSYGPKGIRK